MAEPRVPGNGGPDVELPCGETKRVRDIDLGMREFDCACGETHAVVLDVHPATRFLPEFLVEVLREVVETTSEELPEFGTPHLLGMVMEELPERVVAEDVSDDEDTGFGIVWVAQDDARRLHEIIVELVIELMDHAISHAEDETAREEFEQQMFDFEVSAFVDEYRNERDLSEEDVYV
jgi:hypothetical protein